MTVKDSMTAEANIKSKGDKENLIFKHLPAYASFLLNNHLEDFARELLKISREENVPILKYFESYREEQLIEMGKESNRELLSMASENKLMEAIENSAKLWKENRIPLLEREQVLAEDITIVSLVRRKTFRKFLSLYTTDLILFSNIMEEVDLFIAASETKSFNAYLEIQKEKLSEANNVLALREEQLLEAQELANMGSFVWDLLGKHTSFTRQVSEIFGIERFSNFNSFMEFVHPDDIERLKQSIDRALKGNGIYECEYRFVKDDKTKIIWSRGKVEFADGKATMMKGTIMDITHRHQLVENLKASELRYHNMVEEIQDYAIIGLDKSGVILNWNKGAEKIKGYKAEEIIGKNFRAFYSEEDRKKNIPEKLLTQAERTGRAAMEGWRIRKDGTKFWGSIVITALHDEEKNLIGFSKVTRDLTERKLAEDRAKEYTLNLEGKNEELEHVNKELESFNYVASHDLQEPLRKIQTYCSRLLEKETTNLSESAKEFLEKINAASARMQNLIVDLLTFSQTAAPSENYLPTDLNELLAESQNVLAHSIEETKTSIASESLPTVNVVPFQFQQVFLNLLSNAIKYRKEDVPPKISITSSVVNGADYLAQGASPFRNYLLITFADNGIGFEQQYKDKVFELFQRLHGKNQYSGTGIGLAICKKIISNYNGFITVDSEPAIGSRFQVFLPDEAIIQKQNGKTPSA